MINPGLYKVEFRTAHGMGSGVVTLGNGKFQGGDGAFYYVGTFSEEGDKFSATVHVKRHSAGSSVVPENATIQVQGTSTETSAQLAGTVVGVPGMTFQAHIKRLAD